MEQEPYFGHPRIEDWGNLGMPPVFITVLHTVVLYQGEDYLIVEQWISGRMPHLGKVIDGYTGIETVVRREIRSAEMERFFGAAGTYRDKFGLLVRVIRDF